MADAVSCTVISDDFTEVTEAASRTDPPLYGGGSLLLYGLHC